MTAEPAATSAPTVLLLGDLSPADLSPVEQAVRSLVPAEHLRTAVSAQEVEKIISDGWMPDVVVIGQNWSDEFPASDIQQLLSHFPLARWYCCFGPWCDSDGRSRDLWPLAIRIRAADAPARLRRDLTNSGQRSPLPWTASRSEIFEEFVQGGLPSGLRSLRVAVSSPDRAWRDLWLCALRRAGCQILSTDEIVRAQVVLWDADPWGESRAAELSSLHGKLPQVKVLAAVGWYSDDLASDLRRHGATAVVCKLSSISDILQTIVG